MKRSKSSNSFTLIELLIVIGILAILTAAVVVVLNPAELLKQSRDSKRMQDLSSIDSTIQTLQALVPDIDLGTASTVYVSIADTSSTCSNLGLPTLPSGWAYNCVTETNLHKTDGNGWIPINFQDSLSGGAIQLSSLPIDPTNTTSTGLYYTYTPGGSYELTAQIESDKYANNSAKDGGVDPAQYEKGTDLTLSPFTHGLVGYWKFDETSGTTAYDSSGFGNNGTMYSDTTATDLVIASSTCPGGGRCLSLDGVDDFVDCGNDASLYPTNITISAWVKANTIPGNMGIISNKHDSNNGINLEMGSSNKIGTLVSDGSSWTYIKTSWGPGSDVWYYVVATHSGTTNKIYVNGVLENTGTKELSYYGVVQNTIVGRFYVPTTNNYIFDGNIDDVRIYSRALSASEISAIYNATK